MSPKFDEQTDDYRSICPYCKESYQVEFEEFDEEEEFETECVCGMKYYQHAVFTVTHHTRPDCELNNQKHTFEGDVCVTCGKFK